MIRLNVFAPDGVRKGIAHRDSTFSLAFRLLRPRLRAELLLLYGALRTLDDLVDEQRPEAAERVHAVESWCRNGVATSPEAHVFADLAARRGLGPESVAAFCLAMRHDLSDSTIVTQAELELYCRRVAGSVGVMVAQITGVLTPAVERQMTALRIGVQLTHILRDIDIDQIEGRTYIPLEAIESFGSIAPGRREPLLREQISRANAFLDEAAPVYPMLGEGKRAVAACGALYREILRQIEREGFGRKTGSPVVPRWRQYMIIARACLPAK